MDKVIVVGAGGHGRVVGELVELSTHYELAGWVDKESRIEELNGIKILGGDDDLEIIFQETSGLAVIGVGSMGNATVRRKLVDLLKKIGYDFPWLKHPSAVTSSRVVIGKGTCIMAGCIVQTGVEVADHCILNSGSVIEHDCHIGSFSHIAPGATLAGDVIVEENVHIGLGATIREGVKIGAGALIGAGAVVLKDVEEGTKVAGCPARKI